MMGKQSITILIFTLLITLGLNSYAQPNTISTKGTIKVEKTSNTAKIQVSCFAGNAPLIVDFKNIGTGKQNTWKINNETFKKDTLSFVFKTQGMYNVILSSIDSKGSLISDSIIINVFDTNSVHMVYKFSPNNDGKNDYFIVEQEDILEMNIKVYEIYKNELVYESSDLRVRWEGKNLKGDNCKAGIYYFIINSTDLQNNKSNKKGYISLVR